MLINVKAKSPKIPFAQRVDKEVLSQFTHWKNLYRKKTGNSVDTASHIEQTLIKLTESLKSELLNKYK